jgi:hypothetical protein
MAIKPASAQLPCILGTDAADGKAAKLHAPQAAEIGFTALIWEMKC